MPSTRRISSTVARTLARAAAAGGRLLTALLPSSLARRVLDGVQIHAYSWTGTASGRTGTHPEDPASNFGVVLEQIRYWRTAAGDRFPLYVAHGGIAPIGVRGLNIALWSPAGT